MTDVPVEDFPIRIALVEDAEQIENLIAASVHGLQASEYSQAQRDGALGFAFGVDRQLIADRTYYVCEWVSDHGSELVACGGWSYRRTLYGSDRGPHRQADLLNPAYDAAKIRAIFVHPGWSRRGLGSRLLEHCESAAHAAGFRKLEMGSTLTGIPLYALRGYALQENIGIALPNGEVLPIVRMTKELAPQLASSRSNLK